MHNSDYLVKLIKKAAMDALNASAPANVFFGTVLSASPLQIQVDTKLILTSASLILTKNVTTHQISMTVEHETEETGGGSGDSSFASHKHSYKGTKLYTVNNGLTVGEKVVLIRASGGQKYVVIDRVGRM